MKSDFISIETIGVLRVSGSDGANLTPAGARPRALLAVIALSPRKTAARRWLETLLWEDRNAQQASGSLRQALSTIRRSLGEHADILRADRLDVALDEQRSRVDLLDTPDVALGKVAAGRDLLEGIDIQSDPFEDWLRHERASLRSAIEDEDDVADLRGHPPSVGGAADPTGSAPGLFAKPVGNNSSPLIFAEMRSSGTGLEAFIADSISSQLGRTATEHVRMEVVLLNGQPANAVLAPGSRCTIRVIRNGKRMMALARLSREPAGNLFWSRQISFDADDELAGVDAAASLALEATEAVVACEAEASDPAMANAMAAAALQDVFSFDPERLKKADTLLANAQMLDPLAPRPALRALAKAFLAVERSTGNVSDLRDETNVLIREALASDPDNPLALAFIADVHDLVFDDPLAALSYAERALQIDPGTGYAYASLGGLELRRGHAPEALAAALRARRQLKNTSLQVFSLMRFCLAAMNSGKFVAATEAAEKAAFLAPTSRPPLRHLYALRLRAGDEKGAREALIALRKLEPDFSMSRIRSDPEFPAATIRSVGLDNLTDAEI